MSFHKVVFGADFSPSAEQGARWLIRHFAPGAELTLVHALELPHLPEFLGEASRRREVAELARRGAEERLAELAGSLDGARVRTVVHEGRPADLIAGAAQELGADLLAVGDYGERRAIWKMLGSTVDRLLRSTALPLLLLRNPPAGPPRRILLPVDESEHAARALQVGRALAEEYAAEIRVIHVVTEWYARQVSRVASAAEARDVQAGLVARARDWLDEAVTRAGITAETARSEVRSGDPSYEVLAAAEAFQADLVVTPATGAGLTRHVFGSVARAILHAVPCPVLVIERLR